MKILVTGPQRSGTTFVSHCLSRDNNLVHIDEGEFSVHSFHKFMEVTSMHRNWVAQGPGLMPHLIRIQNVYPDITFVIIKRRTEDIQKSEKRISWAHEHEEKLNLGVPDDPRPISVIKYQLWDQIKPYFNHYIEFRYEDFNGHPYWLEKEKRSNFHAKQWSL